MIALKRRGLGVPGIAGAFVLLLGGVAAAQGYDTSGQDGGLWLPPGASTYTRDVDFLYKVIFYVVTGMFLLTEGLLITFCILYRRRPGHRPAYTHGSNAAEITWTVIPALMLLGLALWQIPTWNMIKQHDRFPKGPDVTTVDVMAETFSWSYRYPGTKELTEEKKYDITVGRLNVPFGNKVVCNLRSRDVIHSMFIPHMRVKQDAVPGLRQKLWFEPNRIWLWDIREKKKIWVNDPKAFEPGGAYYDKRVAVDISPATTNYQETPKGYEPVVLPNGVRKKVGVLYQGKVLEGQEWDSCDYAVGLFEIACAELCGQGHYRMKSTMAVLPRAAYEHWIKAEAEEVAEPAPIWKWWRD